MKCKDNDNDIKTDLSYKEIHLSYNQYYFR